ncbi:MAG: hypothetical protein ACLT98_00470 [Eggerthellaceae bacterium]
MASTGAAGRRLRRVGFLHVPAFARRRRRRHRGRYPIWAAFGDDVAAVPLEGRAVAVAHLLDEGAAVFTISLTYILSEEALPFTSSGGSTGWRTRTLGAEVRLMTKRVF